MIELAAGSPLSSTTVVNSARLRTTSSASSVANAMPKMTGRRGGAAAFHGAGSRGSTAVSMPFTALDPTRPRPPAPPGRCGPAGANGTVNRMDAALSGDGPGFEPLLAPEGWAYASMLPVEDGDPGRFHALFGRDSLIFALQVLPVRPAIAHATLRALAALQGRVDDAEIDEEPGKIIHEYRPVAPAWLVKAGWPVRDGGIRYYGTADATSWFLVLLAAARDAALAAEFEAAWRAAAGWLERRLDRGDGLVRHGPRTHPGGLVQQGWRDALDPAHDPYGHGILRPDGTVPTAPLADRKSTRLYSSHPSISYAVFCLKKKNNNTHQFFFLKKKKKKKKNSKTKNTH